MWGLVENERTAYKYLQENSRYWSVGLGAPLGDSHTEKLKFFSVSGIFSGKAESVTLLGFEYTVNP